MGAVGRVGVCDRCRGRIESDQEYEWLDGARMVHAGQCFDSAPGVREKVHLAPEQQEALKEKIEERKDQGDKEPDAEKDKAKEEAPKSPEAPAVPKAPEGKQAKEKDKGFTKSIN